MSKRKKVIFIRPLEHHFYLDKFVTFFLKGFLLGALYSIKQILSFIVARSGYKRDYNSELLTRAYDEALENGASKFMVGLGLSIILDVALLDNAYNVILRKILRRYVYLVKKNKFEV